MADGNEIKRQGLPLVKCPHCEWDQELVFQQLRWPVEWTADDSPSLAAVQYICEHCGGKIRETDRPKINALYTRSFGEVAKAFLDASKEPTALRFFIENWLGEKWKDAAGNEVEPAAVGGSDEPCAAHSDPVRKI